MKLCCGQRGQSIVEFLTIFALFASLLMGLFEMTRAFRAKYVLTTATFSAARIGALHNARAEPMGAELANGMSALYVIGSRNPEALLLARARAQALEALPGVGVQIVSPTKRMYDGLARQQWVRRADEGEYGWHRVIPNDNLRWRPRDEVSIDTVNGGRLVNVQDANLLKVRSVWCHRLVVPALDRLIFMIATSAEFTNARQAVCAAVSVGSEAAGVASGYYIAVSADSIVRMQSPVVADDLP